LTNSPRRPQAKPYGTEKVAAAQATTLAFWQL